MKKIITLLAFFLLVENAFAARPMITDDARIIDPQSCQVESWVKSSKDSEEYWALPACNPLGFFELTLGGSKVHSQDPTDASGRVVQAKTVFRELKPNDWAIGFALGRNHHLAASDLASHHDVYGYIPVTWSLNNDQQFLHLNLGAIKSQLDSVLRKTWGVGAELEITPRTFLIAETYGVDGVKPSYQAGVRYWLQPNKFQVDLTTGSKANYTTENRWFSIGIRLLLGN
jgi:hypothetical protein